MNRIFKDLIIMLVVSMLPACFFKKSAYQNKPHDRVEHKGLQPVSDDELKAGIENYGASAHDNQSSSIAHWFSPLSWFNNSSPIDEDLKNLVAITQAKHDDIPHPFISRPIKDYFSPYVDQHGAVMGYETEQALDDVVKFYAIEMERHGWYMNGQVSGYETMLSFEKPFHQAIISLRSDGHINSSKNVKIIIFLIKKERQIS